MCSITPEADKSHISFLMTVGRTIQTHGPNLRLASSFSKPTQTAAGYRPSPSQRCRRANCSTCRRKTRSPDCATASCRLCPGSPGATLSVPAVQRSLRDASAPAERVERPGEAHEEPAPRLRLHQIASVDLEGARVARGNDPHEREHLSRRAPEAEDALAEDRAVRAEVPLRINARDREDAGKPIGVDVPRPDGTTDGRLLTEPRPQLLTDRRAAARDGIPPGLR